MTKRSWGNPYTHEEHERETMTNTTKAHRCDWCGQKPKRLYKYDNTRGWFCNKGCWKDYHM